MLSSCWSFKMCIAVFALFVRYLLCHTKISVSLKYNSNVFTFLDHFDIFLSVHKCYWDFGFCMRKDDEFCFFVFWSQGPNSCNTYGDFVDFFVNHILCWKNGQVICIPAYSRHGIRLCVKWLISGESSFVRFGTMSFMNVLKSVGLSVLPCCTPLHSVIAGNIPLEASVCMVEFVYMFLITW